MDRITVYCGSSVGNSAGYAQQAHRLGQMLASRQIALVYGGGNVGLMGEVADGAREADGYVIGVIPTFLKEKELAHQGIDELIETSSMHERKARMSELGDGFIALPGGFGTLEELFEMLTWAQLALHRKPVGLLNIDGYFDTLLRFVDEMIEKGFVKKEYRQLFLVSDRPDDLLDQMSAFIPVTNEKWFTPAQIKSI